VNSLAALGAVTQPLPLSREISETEFVERAYRNLGYVLLTLPPIFVAGFWFPYIGEFPHFAPAITVPVHLHALLLVTFLAMLVLQPLALRARANGLHRLLGRSSYVLMPLICLSAVAMIVKEYHEHLSDGMNVPAARDAEFLSTVQLLLLAALYGLAVSRIRKRDVPAHMRYMICIVLVLLPAGLARTFGYWFGVRQSTAQAFCLAVIDACLIGLIWFDRRGRSPTRPYIVALAAYMVIEAGWVALGRPV
jgi:uncharacterized membrane protein